MRSDAFVTFARRGALAAILCTLALPALAQSENSKKMAIISLTHTTTGSRF